MVEWELMSLYGTALGDTLSMYHFAMSSDEKYEVLSYCASVVQTKFLSVSASSSRSCCLQSRMLNLFICKHRDFTETFKPLFNHQVCVFVC